MKPATTNPSLTSMEKALLLLTALAISVLFVSLSAAAQPGVSAPNISYGGGSEAGLLQQPRHATALQVLLIAENGSKADKALAARQQAELTTQLAGLGIGLVQLVSLDTALQSGLLDGMRSEALVAGSTRHTGRAFAILMQENGRELACLAQPWRLEDFSLALALSKPAGMAWPELEAKLERQQLTGADMGNLIKLRDLAGLPSAQLVLDFLAKTGPNRWADADNWRLIQDQVFDWQSEPMLYLMHHEAHLSRTWGKAVHAKIEQVCLAALLSACRNQQAAPTYTELRARMLATNYKGMGSILAVAEVHRHKLLQHWPEHALAAHELFDNYGSTDAAELDEEARTVWRHLGSYSPKAPVSAKKALRWATAWAKRAVSLKPEVPQYHETLAVLLLQSGEATKAQQHAATALQLARNLNMSVPEAEKVWAVR